MKSTAFLLMSVFYFISCMSLYGLSDQLSFGLFVTNVIIVISSLLVLLFDGSRKSFCLFQIYFIFTFIFFGIVPSVYEAENIVLRNSLPVSDETKLLTNLLIILSNFLFYFFYRHVSIIPAPKVEKYLDFHNNYIRFIQHNLKKCLNLVAILILVCCIIVLMYHNFYLIGLFVRGGVFSNVSFDSTTEFLLVERFVRPVIFSGLLWFLVIRKNISDKKMLGYLFFFCSLVLLFCFPTGLPRFSSASYYIALVCILGYFSRPYVFQLSIIVGLTFILPILGIFRRFTSFSFDQIKFGADFFQSGNFDAYQNFTLVVEHGYITYGKQLLGVVFFFVPRALWPDKSIGSGALVAEKLNLSFANISMPFLGEGYVNFGVVGVIVFVIALAIVCRTFDQLFSHVVSRKFFTILSPIYLYSLGMLFFILRGDLLSSVAYTIGIIFSYYIVVQVSIFFRLFWYRKSKSFGHA